MVAKPGHPQRRYRPALGGLFTLVIAAASSSCSPSNNDLQGRLHVLVATASDEELSTSHQDNILKNARFLASEFNKLHPKVSFTFSVAREGDLETLIARRQWMGLGPDLVLTSTRSATRLHAQGHSQPVTLKTSLLHQLDQSALQRLRRRDGTLSGIPMTRYPDLACYNTESLGSAPPKTLRELLLLEQRGLESGLAIEDRHLLWSAGAFGADGTLAELLNGARATDERRLTLRRWLTWLRDANQVAGIYFLNSMNQLAEQLEQGKLDWIMCNSWMIPRLRQALGPKLGVAVLPRGTEGEPSRIIRQQVWVLTHARHSRQQALAEALVRFSVNSPFQALFSLTRSNSLPVNTVVAPQISHQDPTVRTMVAASRHRPGSLALAEAIAQHDDKMPAINQVLRQVIDSEVSLDEGLRTLILRVQPAP